MLFVGVDGAVAFADRSPFSMFSTKAENSLKSSKQETNC